MNANGEIWCAPNPTVRMGRNGTMGRGEVPDVACSRSTLRKAGPHLDNG